MRPERVIDSPCINCLELRLIYIRTLDFTEYLGQGLQGLPMVGPLGSTKMRPEGILDSPCVCQLSRIETYIYRYVRLY